MKITQLLNLGNLNEYTIHLACENKNREQPLDVLSNNFDDWMEWNSYRRGKDRFPRKYIFSLAQNYHKSHNSFIFGGIFKIVERYDDYATRAGNVGYKIELVEEYRGLIGRLEIKVANVSRKRELVLANKIDDMTVVQITEQPYHGVKFPGYENVCISFSQLELIIKKQKQDWKVALENIKGVYVIVDKSNGKKYVGSAYGEAGIWSRWSDYVYSDGHGNNDELVKLISKNGADYAKSNFQLAILEILSMKTDVDTVIHRENFWKDVLQTKGAFGYNKN